MKKLDNKGWKKVRFGEVCRNLNVTVKSPEQNGYDKVIGLENIESGSLHIKTWGDLADGTTFTKTFEPGQVLFGKRRAYLKKAALAEFKGLCSGDILVFEAITKVLHPKLLPFIVSSDRFFDYAVKTSAGSLSPRTKFQDLANFEFYLPPLEQQEKLAELLWAGNKLVHSLQEISIKLDQIIKSKLFLISETNNKVDNEVKKVEEVVDVLDNKRKPLNEKERYEMKGNIPYFGANGVVDYVNDFIFDEELVLIAEDGGSFHEYQTKPIAYKISGKSWVNNHAHVLRAKSNLTIDWLFYSLVHKDIRNFIIGSTRTKLNKSELLKIKVWAPPLDVQLKLVSEFNDLTNNQTLANKQADDVSALSKEIINNIFNGI